MYAYVNHPCLELSTEGVKTLTPREHAVKKAVTENRNQGYIVS